MLAMIHGAMFHVAAVEHVSGKEDVREESNIPIFPRLQVGGPTPQHIDPHAPPGMRFLFTAPPGGPAAGQTGVGFRDFFQSCDIDYENRRERKGGRGLAGRVLIQVSGPP